MSFYLNQTDQYHKNDMEHLLWEVTVCNSMEPVNSPVREILEKNLTYGELLGTYLFNLIPEQYCTKVMEVGGGYGYLMRDLLRRCPGPTATMVDISPAMTALQRRTLEAFDITYIQSDFFDLDPGLLQDQDLVVMNEILGDFPTACRITKETAIHGSGDGDPLAGITDYIREGIIEIPDDEPFNLNIGAIRALSMLCSSEVPYIFISEHSCEASVTDHMAPYIKLNPSGNPEEIKLIGHSEYTVRFSHLAALARHFGYTVLRGNYTDFIKVRFSNKIHRLFKSNSQQDDHEIIRHFIEDLYIYEYLLLIRTPVMAV